jgi:hypothetical protein
MNEQQVLQLCTQNGLDSILIDGVSASHVLVACVEVESNFDQYAIHLNMTANGAVDTIDYGICQINDFWHIGENKDFPTTWYVLSNPQECIEWMIEQFKEGHQDLWDSFTSGAYKQFLPKVVSIPSK